MNRELVWLMLPVVGLLSQLGGTYNKSYRRWGVPSVITIASLLFLGFSWWWPVLFICVFAVTTLPVTLKGDGIPECWVNWVWVWVLGFLYALPSVIISGDVWTCLVSSIVCGIVCTLSNIKYTAKYFPWKFCEFIIWAMAAYCYALGIQLR